MVKKNLLTALLLFLFCYVAIGQTMPVSLNVKKGTYAGVFKSIEQQSKYTFLINETELNTEDTISMFNSKQSAKFRYYG